MPFFRKKRVGHIRQKTLFEQVKKRTRIVVIDDEKESFPFELMKTEGYAVDHWHKVKSLSELEKGAYDIIILDIGGVAAEYSSEDGLAVLEHLKQVNPSQVVVAFSGQSFDLSKNRFWRMADDSLSKPVDVPKCKRLIDNLIRTKLTVANYWAAIVELLRRDGLEESEIGKLEHRIAKSLDKGDASSAGQSLRSACKRLETAGRVAELLVKLAALVS